jgi:hypothetical protein
LATRVSLTEARVAALAGARRYARPGAGLVDGLLVAFWERVCLDLSAGDAETLAWLASPAFDRWALLSFDADPADVRARFLDTPR